MAQSAINKRRQICEIEECPNCDSLMLTNYNDSNIEAYAICDDCGAVTPLKFAEPYLQGVHGDMKDWADSRDDAVGEMEGELT